MDEIKDHIEKKDKNSTAISINLTWLQSKLKSQWNKNYVVFF